MQAGILITSLGEVGSVVLSYGYIKDLTIHGFRGVLNYFDLYRLHPQAPIEMNQRIVKLASVKLQREGILLNAPYSGAETGLCLSSPALNFCCFYQRVASPLADNICPGHILILISLERKRGRKGRRETQRTHRANIKEENKLLKAASDHFVFSSSVWDISWSPAVLSLVDLPFWN